MTPDDPDSRAVTFSPTLNHPQRVIWMLRHVDPESRKRAEAWRLRNNLGCWSQRALPIALRSRHRLMKHPAQEPEQLRVPAATRSS
jgi:hypothetical protein